MWGIKKVKGSGNTFSKSRRLGTFVLWWTLSFLFRKAWRRGRSVRPLRSAFHSSPFFIQLLHWNRRHNTQEWVHTRTHWCAQMKGVLIVAAWRPDSPEGPCRCACPCSPPPGEVGWWRPSPTLPRPCPTRQEGSRESPCSTVMSPSVLQLQITAGQRKK